MKLGSLQVSFVYLDETTICTVANEKKIATGFAKRKPSDLFNKNEGRKYSLARALKNMLLSKEERIAVWNDYRNLTKTPRW